MNPNLCRVVLRPRSPFEVFDLGVRFIRVNLGVLTRMTALTVGMPWLLLAVLCVVFDGSGWLLLLPLPLCPFIQAPFTILGGRLLFRDDVTVRETLMQIARGGAGVVGIGLAALVNAGLSLMTCGFGFLPLTAALQYVPETLLLERVGWQRGLQRSLRLAGGHSGIAFAGAVGWVFLTAWSAAVFEGLGMALLDTTLQLGAPFGTAFEGKVTPFLLLGILLAQPMHAIYRLLLYVDVRTRIEGWDLQVGLRAAGLERQERR